ncbi:hypothetical protein OG530_26170 [Streptomyces decoyicus]|uniref:hypothetical protein n=1 Tax=Streptomyces decoyicus TaxID=249567 RepID=UPI002E1983ED
MQHQPAWTHGLSQPTLLPAGEDWDAVRVPADVGLRAVRDLEARGVPVGPVLHDQSSHRTYFLTPPGTAHEWAQEGTRALGIGTWVVLAPPDWDGLLQWITDPSSGPVHTAADDLAAALATASEEAEH